MKHCSCTLYFFLIIVKSLQLCGRRQIAEPRKYCLVRVIVFFDVCFLYLFCFSHVGILVKFPTKRSEERRVGKECIAWFLMGDLLRFSPWNGGLGRQALFLYIGTDFG